MDFGPGVVRRAAAAQQKGIGALNPINIRHAFVTHLHSDHTVGYPDLIFTPWVIGRKVPLEVYGPPGIKAMTDHVLAAWAEDITIRNGPIERDLPEHGAEGYRVNAHEISPGLVYKDDNVTVTAFNVNHGEWVMRAFGYRFQTADRSIVITGDSSPSDTARTARARSRTVARGEQQAGNVRARDLHLYDSLRAIRAAVFAVLPDVPLRNVTTMARRIHGRLRP